MTGKYYVKTRSHLIGALAAMMSTLFIAGCPVLDDDLFSNDDTDRDTDDVDVNDKCDKGFEMVNDKCVPIETASDVERDSDTIWVDDPCVVAVFRPFDACPEGGFLSSYYSCVDAHGNVFEYNFPENDFPDMRKCYQSTDLLNFATDQCRSLCGPDSDIVEDTDDIGECFLDAYDVSVACDGGDPDGWGFRYVKYQCSDGRGGTLGSPEACETADTWKKYVSDECENNCVDTDNAVDSDVDTEIVVDTDDSAFCEPIYYDVYERCDDGFVFARFTCGDGRSGTMGGDSSCKPEDVWVKYIYEECAMNCKDTSTDVDTEGVDTDSTTLCGVDKYALLGECEGGGYSGVQFVCNDGFADDMWDDKNCFTEEQWREMMYKACWASCDMDTEEDTEVIEWCGLEYYDVAEECDGGYLYVRYSCTDGSGGGIGDGATCLSQGDWKDIVYKECEAGCKDTSSAEDTDVVDSDDPTQCARLAYIDIYDECEDGGFRIVKFECSDGWQGSFDGNGACVPADVWTIDASKTCDSRCI
ncbi:MAG: hypothetical protein JXR76_32800 [Deltaproteobacteria bacterium]|nr:hypothetical protein [Deltaproteobacteria bacterium]